jgi:hypothetical protein
MSSFPSSSLISSFVASPLLSADDPLFSHVPKRFSWSESFPPVSLPDFTTINTSNSAIRPANVTKEVSPLLFFSSFSSSSEAPNNLSNLPITLESGVASNTSSISIVSSSSPPVSPSSLVSSHSSYLTRRFALSSSVPFLSGVSASHHRIAKLQVELSKHKAVNPSEILKQINRPNRTKKQKNKISTSFNESNKETKQNKQIIQDHYSTSLPSTPIHDFHVSSPTSSLDSPIFPSSSALPLPIQPILQNFPIFSFPSLPRLLVFSSSGFPSPSRFDHLFQSFQSCVSQLSSAQLDHRQFHSRLVFLSLHLLVARRKLLNWKAQNRWKNWKSRQQTSSFISHWRIFTREQMKIKRIKLKRTIDYWHSRVKNFKALLKQQKIMKLKLIQNWQLNLKLQRASSFTINQYWIYWRICFLHVRLDRLLSLQASRFQRQILQRRVFLSWRALSKRFSPFHQAIQAARQGKNPLNALQQPLQNQSLTHRLPSDPSLTLRLRALKIQAKQVMQRRTARRALISFRLMSSAVMESDNENLNSDRPSLSLTSSTNVPVSELPHHSNRVPLSTLSNRSTEWDAYRASHQEIVQLLVKLTAKSA